MNSFLGSLNEIGVLSTKTSSESASSTSTSEIVTSDQQEHGRGDNSGHHGPEAEFLLFFIIICLFFAAVLREIYKKTQIPFTPMIVVFGVILEGYKNLLGAEEGSIEKLSTFNPHLLLFIFIPILIFESALNMDYYIFRRSIINCILLAGPGVLITAFLIALTIKNLLGYTDEEGITWNAALTIGCIAGATDPVAVVALLKELGAPLRFNVLIEGQSLLNDGSAMVFFDLFLQMVKGEQQSGIQVVGSFIRLAICGPILGVVVGVFAALWLQRVIRDDILTSLITFMACYTSFFLAQYSPLHVSGILSVVALGCFMSAVGKTKIYHESQHSLHTVWAFIQWCCQSLLFLITGILIGREFKYDENILFQDWINMVILWAVMILIRMFMVFFFYPFYKFGGYELNWREVFVMGYGGLRGALGLCLALIVGVDPDLNPRFRALTVFSLSVVAIMTLVVNGLTAQFFVEKLGIVPFPDIKIRILKNTLTSIMDECQHKESILKQNQYLSMAKWKNVEEFYSLKKTLDELNVLEAKKLFEKKERSIHKKEVDFKRVSLTSKEYQGHSETEILTQIRYITLKTIKGLVWEKFQSSEFDADCSYVIDDAINMALDYPDQKFQMWKYILENLSNQWLVQRLIRFKDVVFIGPIIRSGITHIFGNLYEISTVFLHIIEEASQVMNQIPVQTSSLHEIKEELHSEVKQIQEFIMHLASAYPEIMVDIQTKRASLVMMHHVLHELDTHYNTGYIEFQDYINMRNYLDMKTTELENAVPSWNIDNFDQSILQYPIFANLNNTDIEKILAQGKKSSFKAGELLAERNKPLQGIFVLLSGFVVDSITTEAQKICPPGSVIGASSLIAGTDKSLTKAKAKTDVTVLELSIAQFVDILKAHQKIRKNIVTQSCFYFIQLQPETSSFLEQMDQKSMSLYLNDSTIEGIPQNSLIEYKFGGLVLQGLIACTNNPEIKFGQFAVIDEFSLQYFAAQDSQVIRFNQACPEKSNTHHVVEKHRTSFFSVV